MPGIQLLQQIGRLWLDLTAARLALMWPDASGVLALIYLIEFSGFTRRDRHIHVSVINE